MHVSFAILESRSASSDMSFGIPRVGADVETEKERLIKMGHLTPFGSKLEELTGTSSNEQPVPDDAATAELGMLSAVASTAVHSDTACTSLPVSVVHGNKDSGIRLCSDSFNGLFTSDSAPVHSLRKNSRRIARIPKRKDGGSEAEPGGSSLLSGNSTLETDGEVDEDDWIPSLAQLMNEFSSSSESEYLTDEDMGEVRVKRRLRDLSSGSEVSSGDERARLGKGRKRKARGGQRGKKKRRTANCNDDGDEEVFHQRIQ